MTGIPRLLRQRRPLPLLVAFLCFLVVGLAPQASAAGSGAFSPTGSMSVPRPGAAAAPLPEGRVLVVGGDIGFGASFRSMQSTEAFDPATGTFSPTGSMSVPRVRATAAPLPDGRVLVAGGNDHGRNLDFSFRDNYLSSAEVFNPTTNAFSSAGIGSLSTPGVAAAAAPLPDGRVLVVGGSTSGAGPVSSAEVFDPATNSFSSAGIGSMSAPRAVAAPLPDGRVLVAGGGYFDASAEVFAPVSCRGRQATIVGSDGADQIAGTRGADVIMGVGGDDWLSGGAGNDLICGGQGDDTLKGGPGKDSLKGGADKDSLTGGVGKDSLKGGPGKDVLKGGPGKDILKGGGGKDKQVQ
jgi:Ca2+-binding RTX toxin-like protein